MDLDVLFVGTAGSAPTAARGLPALLVRRGGDKLLFDCGEGTQRQLLRSTGLIDLEEVFLTHFHADHVLGLPGMLKTYSLHGRERPLTVHGPPGLKRLLAALEPIIGRTTFEVGIVELEANQALERDGYRVAAFEVAHRVRAHGYALVEDARPGRFDPEAARRLGVAPTRAVVVEDAISGVQAGRHGHFGLVIGVARKGNAEELRHYGAHLVVHDLGELVD
jgi:ribonuclease Z